MLQAIKIRNFALIENAEIPFEKGLNVLSGETGAGKSIVLEAISLLLGGRAQTEVIRSGAEEAVVEGLFEVSELPWLKERLNEVGIELDQNELLIKRTINRNGKNRIFMNGELASGIDTRWSNTGTLVMRTVTEGQLKSRWAWRRRVA